MLKNTVQRSFVILGLAFFVLVALPFASFAQVPPPADDTEPVFEVGIIERIAVIGNERIEGSTITTYITVNVGSPFNPQAIDDSLKQLFATGLFADVVMERNVNTLIIRVVENPIINLVVFEGNSRLKDDDLLEEAELRPRMIYTRSKVRSDVQRIIELYRRSGRFAAVVEPKVIQREQNRVDLVFEISEGPKSRVSRINFIGNRAFSDKKLKGEVATTESRWWKIFSSNDTYDPDRIAFDREEVRQFYLENGYADVRIVSAVAELTPDQKDFFITYVIEEGELYTFGEIKVESEINALPVRLIEGFVRIKEGTMYNATLVENTVENITNAAGVVGFAFLDVRPEVERDRENRTLSITFRVLEAPRAYIEKINIRGNFRTLDRIIRREFRLSEGDAFNSIRVRRSEQRLRLLGFFGQVTVEQLPGSAPDKVVLDVTVEEQATGEFSLGLGFSSFDGFIFDTSISERNLLGKGQSLQLSLLLSSRRNNIVLSFTQPYVFGRNMNAGFTIFRQVFENREASFQTNTIGFSTNVRFPITEFINMSPRYTLRQDTVKVAPGIPVSPFLADSIGTNLTSAIGYTLSYVDLNDFRFPTDGFQVVLQQDLAGLGGNIKYVRTTVVADYYQRITGEWIGHIGFDGGVIIGLGQDIRINDRFFLGNPKFRGFDVAGVGPIDTSTGDFLGGNIFYVISAGVVIPLGDFAEELGFQLSAFVDAGTLYKTELALVDQNGNPIDNSSVVSSNAIRIAVGIGLTWESPFGPVRLDVARVIRQQPTDRTKTIQFNVGTRF